MNGMPCDLMGGLDNNQASANRKSRKLSRLQARLPSTVLGLILGPILVLRDSFSNRRWPVEHRPKDSRGLKRQW